MKRKYKALDLFCGCGGVSAGLHHAGFQVVGVDIAEQPNYYDPERFHVADALRFAASHSDVDEFDLIWASPPCQQYSFAAARWKDRKRVGLIADTRKALEATGKPYVIENVVQAPLIIERSVTITGPQVGLVPRFDSAGCIEWKGTGKRYIPGVIKMRRFESNISLRELRKVGTPGLESERGSVPGGDYVTLAGHGGNNPPGLNRLDVWQQASGIHWLVQGNAAEKKHSIAEAIPPAMAEEIGKQFMQFFKG